MILMPEQKEGVLLPFFLEIEEEYTVFINQFESTQLKSYVVDQIMDELPKVAECHEKNEIYHVFFDPRVEYMEEFYSPYLQLYFHYEEQIHFMLLFSFQYHAYFGLKCSHEVQVSD